MTALERKEDRMMISRNKKRHEWCALALITCILYACSFPEKVIKSEEIKNIPARPYEKIIRLDTPEGMPLEPDAGFVYVLPGGKVTTDFPREIFVKNLDNLDKYEKLNQDHMQKYIIRDSGGVVRGYYEILIPYRANLWEKGDDILLQIIIPPNRDAGKDSEGPMGIGGPTPGGK
jgi:hypothetical protein